ncbi:hypothetical protein INT43_007601 [Umbelopsis isabellina]|uniref:Uncharacterized protein n=1 Tax=Mortierella isabellina TaxID=91625 RepID=A0A8H7UCW9_MORIS|nr:hypothetical protein INT43_007601 [Umbelopsis isabellina]
MCAKTSSPSRMVKLTAVLMLVLGAVAAVTADDESFDRASSLQARSDGGGSVERVALQSRFEIPRSGSGSGSYKHIFAALEKRSSSCEAGYFLCGDSLGGCCPNGSHCVSGSFTCTYSSIVPHSSDSGTAVSLAKSAALASALALFAQL